MPRLRWSTAGESHGLGIVAFLEGVPAGYPVDINAIDAELRRRQGGFGRGKRMEIENDTVTVISGLKRGLTLGSPLALLVANKDHRIDSYRALTRPRPGHADLAGAIKYGTTDCADIMERASARETAGRVAIGALAGQILAAFGVEVFAWVSAIGAVDLAEIPPATSNRKELRDASPLYAIDRTNEMPALEAISAAREAGDSLGGRIRVEASGLPAGLGSPMQWDLRLDGRLAQALMAIQAIKAVEIGAGIASTRLTGLRFHDPILPHAGGFRRPSNNAGGIEGGMSNGEVVSLTLTMKPIPSVKKPLPSVDLVTGEPVPAVYERSDVCSVPAASVVAEKVASLVLLDALLEKTGGDARLEVERNYKSFRGQGFPQPPV